MSALDPPSATIRWLRTIRFTAYALAVLLAAGAGAALWLRHDAGMEQRLGGMSVAPSVQIGGPFSLTDHTGAAVTDATYRGRLMLIFFGFTHCPDVCPTELQVIAEVLDGLGADADRVAPLFITVDPERDTPALLAEYVPVFDARFLGMYGTPEQIADVAKDFRVFYRKSGDLEGHYTIDHSAGTYVFGPDGRLRLYMRHGETPAVIAADIKALLAGK